MEENKMTEANPTKVEDTAKIEVPVEAIIAEEELTEKDKDQAELIEDEVTVVDTQPIEVAKINKETAIEVAKIHAEKDIKIAELSNPKN